MKSFDRLRTNGKLLIPFVVMLSLPKHRTTNPLQPILAPLIRTYPRLTHQLAPLDGLGFNVGGKLIRRARHRVQAQPQ